MKVQELMEALRYVEPNGEIIVQGTNGEEYDVVEIVTENDNLYISIDITEL